MCGEVKIKNVEMGERSGSALEGEQSHLTHIEGRQEHVVILPQFHACSMHTSIFANFAVTIVPRGSGTAS